MGGRWWKKGGEMITEGVGTFLAPAQLFTQNWPDIDGFNMHELSPPIFSARLARFLDGPDRTRVLLVM